MDQEMDSEKENLCLESWQGCLNGNMDKEENMVNKMKHT